MTLVVNKPTQSSWSTAFFELEDLWPTAAELMEIAHASLSGNPAARPVGRHAGQNHDRRDTQGISKREVLHRARTRDLEWFQVQLDHIKKSLFSSPPSLRTKIPKDKENKAAGTRNIDDPAEIKRLLLLFIRDKIERHAEQQMTHGQLGGRGQRRRSTRYCKLKGATDQDHVATGIRNAIQAGYPVCVLADLKDAFGLVPKALAIRELVSIGLSDHAARWVWRLVRIDAVDSRDRRRRYHRIGRGIEQGNALSAMLMNLVLAPVLHQVEQDCDVRAISYLDDIYLMGCDEAQAHMAFARFNQVARQMGYTNVRSLWEPGRKTKGKLTQIIDARLTCIPVLKTYEVAAIGISLMASKEAVFRQYLRKEKLVFKRMNITQVRKATRCMALTKKAMQLRTNIMKRSPNRAAAGLQQQVNKSPKGIHPPSSSSRGTDGCTARGTQPLIINQGVNGSRDDTRLFAEVPSKDEHDLVLPAEQEQGDKPIGVSHLVVRGHVHLEGTSDQVNQGTGVHRAGGVHAHSVLPADGDGLVPLGDLVCLPIAIEHEDAEVHPPRGDVNQELLAHGVEVAEVGPSQRRSSTTLQVSSAITPSGESGSYGSNGPNKPDRGLAVDEDRRADLSLSHPEVQAAFAEGRRVKLGDDYKGARLNLTGLGDIDIAANLLLEVVNGLIKRVRDRRVALVMIDLAEPWTRNKTILGNIGDHVYERLESQRLSDGRRLLKLRQRRRQLNLPAQEKAPKGIDVTVQRCKCIDLALNTYEVQLIVQGEVRRNQRTVVADNPGTGAILAVASTFEDHASSTVALPMAGPFAVLARVLVAVRAVDAGYANIDFGDAVHALREGWWWRLKGKLLVGRPRR